MATVTTTVLIDDLDGSEASETVQFAIDNHLYEIDLSVVNAGRLRNKLAKFVDAATPAAVRPSRQGRKITTKVIATPGSKEQTRAVRDWARKNGHEVSDRGRIAQSVLLAFHEAH